MKTTRIAVLSLLLAACGSTSDPAPSVTSPGTMADAGAGEAATPAIDSGGTEGQADAQADATGDADKCAPWDAAGVGDACSTLLGWAWGGRACVAVVGCECRGSDCDHLYKDLGGGGSGDLPCWSDYLGCPHGPVDAGRD